jgi:hypothetical protein
MIEFRAAGSPLGVSRAIERYAGGQHGVSALVVPWESDGATIRMAVTAVKADGWAIEHTNLGTLHLSALGQDATQVAVEPHPARGAERPELAALFERFAGQIQSKFQAPA